MYKHIFKRFFDVLISLLCLPIFFIILLIFGPLIYFSDKGTIFYNAERLGMNGTVFKMYKFRSMKLNAPDIRNEDGSTFNSEDDPRLTSIGKFIRKTSIDEVPQILNVLKGDMSIVGPRPDLPEHFNVYSESEKESYQFDLGLQGTTKRILEIRFHGKNGFRMIFITLTTYHSGWISVLSSKLLGLF